jgi:hypothetical protein
MEGRNGLFRIRRFVVTNRVNINIVNPDGPSAYQLHSLRKRHGVLGMSRPLDSPNSLP